MVEVLVQELSGGGDFVSYELAKNYGSWTEAYVIGRLGDVGESSGSRHDG